MKRGVILLVSLLAAMSLQALSFSDRYRSPRNPERRIRPATRLIVLHTTEAHARSSLNKLCERGEAHYCVPEDGTVYRIVDRDRVAFHAGRSMWNGAEDCDDYAIGIEVVGHHDKPVTTNQLKALRELLDMLKKMYRISDDKVVCHSHVAYGAPNRWFPRRHRGRKRCGMLFAMWSVRRQLGLTTRPSYDPDVRARRLIQADPELAEYLYGKRDMMVRYYRTASTAPTPSPPKKAPATPKPTRPVSPPAPVMVAAPAPVIKKGPLITQKKVPAATSVTPAPAPSLQAAAPTPTTQSSTPTPTIKRGPLITANASKASSTNDEKGVFSGISNFFTERTKFQKGPLRHAEP